MRSVFSKIIKIWWNRPGLIFEKMALFIKKIGTVYQKIGVKIRFDHFQFFPLHQIFEHCLDEDSSIRIFSRLLFTQLINKPNINKVVVPSSIPEPAGLDQNRFTARASP
jgi:hypothetical protein